MIVLGIETSCDETAAAVVTAERAILANRVLSQAEAHRPYGGVVPEIAARAHVEHLDSLIRDALDEARVGIGGLDAIAATAGPGLLGGVMVGLVTGKAIAAVAGVPFLAVNHLEGHALSIRLVKDIAFPYLLLMVSGGHCQLLIVKDVGSYRRLGTTIDDAVGEAFYTHARGLYHNRCGTELEEPYTPWTRGDIHQTYRGGFPPDESDYSDHSEEGW